jgi:hypothetical protein
MSDYGIGVAADQYLSGLPGFAPSSGGVGPAVPTSVSPINATSATTTGPKFTTLLLALAGLGVITWIVGPNLGIWVPILALGGYAAAQSGFVNKLLGSYNTSVGG